MDPNAFIGKREQPDDAELRAAIGPAVENWNRLLDDLENEGLIQTREWYSYSPKAGWSLRLKSGKRTILYMGPYQAGFRVAFIFGDKALKAVRESKFPARIMKVIDAAPKYAEGTGVRLDVKAASDVGIVKKLAAIKCASWNPRT